MNSDSNRTRTPFTPNLDAYNSLRENIANEVNTANKTAIRVKILLSVIIILLANIWAAGQTANHPGTSFSGNLGFAFFLNMFPVFFIFILGPHRSEPNRWLYLSEYYSLPESGGNESNHRCIFCGNKGIWRQGQYASYVTYARCSKCKEPLFIN